MGTRTLAPEPRWALARSRRLPHPTTMSMGDGSLMSESRTARFLRPSELRKLRGGEQVAAVCYRIGHRGIEFLLVQTRGGRWTFPKGGVEPGLTHAQTAALEAFEEAGVHGRMEEQSFARYVRRKRNRSSGLAVTEIAVHAHLCKVSRLSPPQEAGRNPTWFSPEKAKRRLQADRAADDGAEFARVVDRAVARIQRLLNPPCVSSDALQNVQFEASPEAGTYARIEEASVRAVHPPTRHRDDSSRRLNLPSMPSLAGSRNSSRRLTGVYWKSIRPITRTESPRLVETKAGQEEAPLNRPIAGAAVGNHGP